ncbi:MAG TPA: sigma-70 family RNA polymerase sigma factor [Acidimicrobiales bacterium]|nr:sigma-70 family RNA polymerase sigma factor [Acidimicrobiales bacterium]
MGHTSGDVGLLRLYLDQIGREPLLTRDEETSLARSIERGRHAAGELRDEGDALTPERRAALEESVTEGERSRQRFLRANLRLVVAVARQWTGSGLALPDLIQEGNVGLLRAVERFDYRRGFRFSTYATWWIRQAIARAAANTGRLVRLPVHTSEALTRVLREQRRLEERQGGPPPLASLAAGSGLRPEQVAHLLQLASEPVSISEPVGDSGGELGAVLADATATSPPDAVVAALLPAEVRRLLDRLPSLEREVMSLRFGFADDEPWSVDAIAGALGLSRQAVRQSQARALRILRRVVSRSPVTRELLAM